MLAYTHNNNNTNTTYNNNNPNESRDSRTGRPFMYAKNVKRNVGSTKGSQTYFGSARTVAPVDLFMGKGPLTVCMCVYTYNVCYMCVYVYERMHVCVRVYVYVCMCVYVCIYVFARRTLAAHALSLP